MRPAGRLPLLPAAATYLAEAERRLGTRRARSVPATAHATSLAMGAFTRSDVHSRSSRTRLLVLDRDPTTATEWRRLLRSFDSSDWTAAVEPSGAVFDIRPFGLSPDIVVDGRPQMFDGSRCSSSHVFSRPAQRRQTGRSS